MLKIYIGINGKPEGPFAFEEIQQMIDKGQLSADSLAWWKGQADWVKLETLPGLKFDNPNISPSQPEDSEKTMETTEPEQPKQPVDFKPDTNKNSSDGITVPDFDINPGHFFLVACRLLISIKSVTCTAVCILFLISFFCVSRLAENNWGIIIFGIFLYFLIAPINGLFMKQFRGQPVFIRDIPNFILRNPKGFLMLGIITQIPNILLTLMGGKGDDSFLVSLICNAIIGLFLFYTTNLLLDKRLSLLNAIMFSVQAVLVHPFKTILFIFLQGCAIVAGTLFFGIGAFIASIITWSAGVYVYLWVFSRDTIHEKYLPNH